ncbi:consortin isoform X2 [Eleutherodactylus coqui]|uniref:consortin isoform X2 n=1 Tax=Eleutherodactylus coqui TaxID=57060 RepID=UPI0034620B65
MNTEEPTQTGLQPNIEDRLQVCPNAEIEKTSFQMASDLNENNLSRDQPLGRNAEISFHNRDAQDSINNNENCNLMCGQLSCRTSCEEDRMVVESLASAPLPTNDSILAKGKRVAGRRNNRNKKPQNETLTEHKDQKQVRDSMFSLIREGFQQSDSRMLPTCLHQIAETYFQEEDYEKAIQFIHLERIYHEQLLANLSAIQEQWETKWKRTTFATPPTLQNSEKGLSCQELEMLSNICGSHKHPQASKCQLPASEKIHQLKGSDGYDVDGLSGNSPDRESVSGIKTSAGREPSVAEMTEHLFPDVSTAGNLTRVSDHQAILPSGGTTLASPTLWSGGRAISNSSLPSGDSGRNNDLLQPHSTNVSEIEPLSKDRTAVQALNPMVDKLIPPSELDTQDDRTGGSNSLQCISFIQPVLTVSSSEDAGDRDTKRIINAESQEAEAGFCPRGSDNQKCLEELNKSQRQATVEFIASLLNGDLKESENFLAHLDFQEETNSEEEMSPNSGESISGENLLSLDELAKRIEIEEVSRVAGLVSILKKRDGSHEENLKQMKRKVRFLETEDVLDQDMQIPMTAR